MGYNKVRASEEKHMESTVVQLITGREYHLDIDIRYASYISVFFPLDTLFPAALMDSK